MIPPPLRRATSLCARVAAILFLTATVGPLDARAQATASVRITATDPARPVELNARQPLYVRLAYESDEPVRIRARGLLAGAEVTGGASMNPAPAYPAGRGEALARISFDGPARIDELRITVFDAAWTPRDSISRRVVVAWSGVPAPSPPAAEWARDLSRAQQRMVSEAAASGGDDGAAWLGGVFLLVTLSVPAYWILQVHAWRRWRDGWRTWALLPLIATGPVLLYTLGALLARSNLWPLVMMGVTPFAFLYLAGLAIARWRALRS